jgi:phosphatidate cytidylyltransferase
MNETLTRSISGFAYVSILIFATLYSKESFLILFCLFMIQAVNEFCNLLNLNKIVSISISILSFLFFALFFEKVKFDFIPILLFVSICVALFLMYLLFFKKTIEFNAFTKYSVLLGYVVFPFIFLIKIPFVATEKSIEFLPFLVVYIFILVWINDTFAYFVGKSVGKNKLFETISPKKTIEGFIGGLIFTLIAGFIIAKYFQVASVLFWILVAVIVSVFGTIGDLVESKFKRKANVKDSGNIMPGHGGILDRLDSVIFVAPFLFLFYKIIEYVS